jgi:hypothetical protein
MTVRFLPATILALAFWLWFTATSPVYADARTLTYTDTITLQKTDWVDMMAIPRSDPAHGILKAVQFTLAGKLEGSAQFESLDAQATTVQIGMSAQIDLQRPTGTRISKATPLATDVAWVTSFDGTLDYAGDSGGSSERLVGIDVAETTSLTSAEDLRLFTGSGNITLPVTASGAARGEGAGNLALSYRTFAEAQVTVTYNYLLPAIDVKKFTNGDDADQAPGPTIPVGQPVTWTYIVRNLGEVALVDVQLIDDKEGVILCPQNSLAVGASMTCTWVGVAQAGQYGNVATVTGRTVPDEVNFERTVDDRDPSHYIGVQLNLCPVDNQGLTKLPAVQYLGQGDGVYTLPAGFETFIVKRIARGITPPFRFDLVVGATYKSPKNLQYPERVWACAGACLFTPQLNAQISIGDLPPGITIGAVVIDDDTDNRRNSWIVNNNVGQPYLTIDNQMMTEYLFLEIPFVGQWSFWANDSIGINEICIASSKQVQTAQQAGNGQEAPLPNELTEEMPSEVTSTVKLVYLPTIYR